MSVVIGDKYSPGTVWCEDVKGYVNEEHIVKIKTGGYQRSFLLRRGRGDIGFVSYQKFGFTIVDTFKMKDKQYCSSYYFYGNPPEHEIRSAIFDNSHTFAHVRGKSKSKNIFKTIFRYHVVEEPFWNKQYVPNVNFTRNKATDNSLISLHRLIELSDGEEVTATTAAACLFKAQRAISSRRKDLAKKYMKSGEAAFPLVEFYAIWNNFDTETMLINTKDYDASEPVVYAHNKFLSIEEMFNFPM